MRVTNNDELLKLIERGLVKDKDKEKALACLGASSPKKQPQTKPPVRIVPLVPTQPSHVLYQRLVQQYGRFASGGEMVFELSFSPLGRNYRLDMAMPALKLGIEHDGWKSHGLYRESFLRDREKSLWFERRGWRVIRFSANQVRDEIADVLLAVEDIASYCPVNTDKAWSIKQVAFDRSEYHHE